MFNDDMIVCRARKAENEFQSAGIISNSTKRSGNRIHKEMKLKHMIFRIFTCKGKPSIANFFFPVSSWHNFTALSSEGTKEKGSNYCITPINTSFGFNFLVFSACWPNRRYIPLCVTLPFWHICSYLKDSWFKLKAIITCVRKLVIWWNSSTC